MLNPPRVRSFTGATGLHHQRIQTNKNVNNMSQKAHYKKTIENHQQAAAHHTEAAKHHLDAAKAYAEDNPEKAAHSAMLAWGHHAIAGEFINDDAKHHAQMLKRTNYR
jgi:hypothetical protein